jgi:single-stranded DNA-binding protein
MALPTVSIIGNINKISLKYSASGMAVCNFQIECGEKNKKGEFENLYIKSTAFDKAAEFINQWFQDGAVCIATGKLVTEVYEKDGVKKYEIKLKQPQIEFAPKPKNMSIGQASQQRQVPIHHESIPAIDIDDTLPF